MKVCGFCNLSDDDKKWLLYENEEWFVFLADKQDYLGRCIIVLKQHCESISDLNIIQWISLKSIMDALEKMIQCEFNATMFNWSCLMNNAYKAEYPNLHIHFHLCPRYLMPVPIGTTTYIDKEFSHHYNNKAEVQLDSEMFQLIFHRMKENVNIYFNNEYNSYNDNAKLLK